MPVACPRCAVAVPEGARFCGACGSPASPASPLSPGSGGGGPAPSLPPRYGILRFLGRGGMGRVYLCRDAELDVEVAIKVLPGEVAADEEALGQIRREARASAMFRESPGILSLYGFEQHGDTRYLVMEFAAGGSLHDRLKREKRLLEADCRRLGAEVAEALAFAHEKKVLHRDIKPANVLLDARGRAKVADFGIARVMADASSRLSLVTVAGTPVYMAPEIILQKKVDHRADLYSLGCMLYEMATGERPFAGSYAEVAMAKTASGASAPDPGEKVPGLSAEFVAAVRRLLAPNPEDRFPDASSCAVALRGGAVAASAGTTGAPSTATRAPASRPAPTGPPPRPGRPRVPLFAALGVLAAGAAAWSLLGRGGGEAAPRVPPGPAAGDPPVKEPPPAAAPEGPSRSPVEEAPAKGPVPTPGPSPVPPPEPPPGPPPAGERPEGPVPAGEPAPPEAPPKEPPAREPSTKEPPVQPAPAEKPPAETPPAEKPSAETPSAEKPPAETPPAEPPPKPAKKAAPVAPAVPGLRAPPEDVLRAQKEIALPAGILRDDDGRLWREKDGAELVLVPAGEFLMGRAPGAGDEMPAHRVAVSAFLLDRHEVTLGQFRRFSAAAGHPVAAQRPESTDAHPVVNVVWEDARAYAAWVAGRLPTEAEFEKALRGGLPGTTYPWGDEGRPHGKPGNYVDMSARSGGGALLRTVIEGYDDGFAGLAPAGALEPNAYGLFDVTGNAWEWCSDFYDPRYYGTLGKEVARDPPGPAAGSARVARGGAWSSNVQFLRCAYRNRMDPTARNDGLGFRVARGVP